MIYPIAFLLGAIYGWQRAGKCGGNREDRLQYAAVFGIIATILSVLAVVLAGFAGLI